MKFYRLRLPKQNGVLQYPPQYEETIGTYVVDHLYYDDSGQAFLLVAIRDVNALAELPQNVIELTPVQAKAISDAFDHQPLRANDMNEVLRLAIKAIRGQALTVDEEKALDPDDATPGFVKRKRLAERLQGFVE